MDTNAKVNNRIEQRRGMPALQRRNFQPELLDFLLDFLLQFVLTCSRVTFAVGGDVEDALVSCRLDLVVF